MEISSVQSNLEHTFPSTEMENSKSPVATKRSKKMPDLSNEIGEISTGTASDHLVVYNSENGDKVLEVENGENHPTPQRSRGLPSIVAFAVQCSKCFKWRLIPSKEQYEKIREQILQNPFICDQVHKWRPDVTCDDPEDISQDGTRLWAIDKPNIARPPLGWERIIRIRGEGSTKFADVHYTSPSGRKLRSMVEIEKYLSENPGYASEGVSLSQFSFQIPRPLQENYVKKRHPFPRMSSVDGGNTGSAKPLDAEEVNPSSLAAFPFGSQSAEQDDSAKVGASATPSKRKTVSLDFSEP